MTALPAGWRRNMACWGPGALRPPLPPRNPAGTAWGCASWRAADLLPSTTMLVYTLCFCRCGGRLLMLLRRKAPNAGRWNGLGGKIEPGEAADACVVREVREESGLDLAATRLRFAGLVTWPLDNALRWQGSGMYVFVADLADPGAAWVGERAVPEGRLRWQPEGWVCDPRNPLVVANIPRFLPPMLRGEPPARHHCRFRGDILVDVVARPLSEAAYQDDAGDHQQHAQEALRADRHLR